MGSERSRGGGRGGQWFIRWVDAELDLFWESGQNFLFNLSKHSEFYTISMSISYNDIEYLVRAKSRILEMPVLKMNSKLIVYNTYVT